MFTRKGNSKFNRDQQTNPGLDENGQAQAQQDAQSSKLSQEQRAAALDAARFPPPPVPDTTLIGKNFNLEGDNIVIRCKGALSINGSVDADIHCEQLTIAQSAHVSGAIAADEVHIHGQVEGTVNGAQVTLHKTADVDADVNSRYLSIERGARFDGRSRRVKDVAEIAPKLMAGANDQQSTTTPDASTPTTAADPAQTPQATSTTHTASTTDHGSAPRPQPATSGGYPESNGHYDQPAQTTPDTQSQAQPASPDFQSTGTN